MQKDVAFVTDEGGLICHTATVASEMENMRDRNVKRDGALKNGSSVEVDCIKMKRYMRKRSLRN